MDFDWDDPKFAGAVVGRLNGELHARGISLPKLAPMLGLSYDTLRNYLLEPGAKDYKEMRIGTFYRICAILNLPPKKIMDDAEQDMNRG